MSSISPQPPRPIATPCVQVCAVDGESGLCLGCYRRLHEVAGWARLEPEARERIMAEWAAEAIEAEHGNGPRVAAAVDQSHAAMGELQKATLAHIFAMRQLLRPDQTSQFDDAVVKALTDGQG